MKAKNLDHFGANVVLSTRFTSFVQFSDLSMPLQADRVALPSLLRAHVESFLVKILASIAVAYCSNPRCTSSSS